MVDRYEGGAKHQQHPHQDDPFAGVKGMVCLVYDPFYALYHLVFLASRKGHGKLAFPLPVFMKGYQGLYELPPAPGLARCATRASSAAKKRVSTTCCTRLNK